MEDYGYEIEDEEDEDLVLGNVHVSLMGPR